MTASGRDSASVVVTDVLEDGRQKDWFWDHNAVFESDLSPNAKLVRLFLARCAGGDRVACVPLKEISRGCGLCKPAVVDALKELEEKGWIARKRYAVKVGKRKVNAYVLLDPRAAS
ncbi:hypothetical protein Adeg_0702 [Ammonifex degensii KC4]|uniref:Helix-turn-helix domain-containing protein n=1 Tax=Ammonifex degensii (strain DSM 10501 / KC4) TaxID=429009 RepID=C9RC72_AMMDK|nr:helix-turn-helix domain-containing protein [Ammonifex degensii]ACX51849.1 hypothetical protein Adeg_0702 [Ammonifex degensii KC4]